MPIVRKIQEINDHFFMSVAQSLFTYLQVNAAKEDEKIIDDPTYPKYKIGGWIAKAGSCNIGFNPKPSFGVGKINWKGLDVKRIKIRKPVVIICWKKIVKILNEIKSFFDLSKKIKVKRLNTHNQSNRLPSWFPHVPEIL